jgi:hypothetical protein
MSGEEAHYLLGFISFTAYLHYAKRYRSQGKVKTLG